jgi:RimJ/RimL family protein N-acetyltransferase
MTVLDRIAPETARHRSVPVLETRRLVLRAPRLDDAAALATLADDLRIAANTLRIPHPYSLADAQAFITSVAASERETAFLIAMRDDTVIGACGVAMLDGRTPELGYWLGVAFWGRGYATEAARAVIDHAFGDLGHDALLAGARVSNPASRRVLQKCGFQWTGVGLYRIRAIASSAPVDRFRLDRSLWASLRSWGAGTSMNEAVVPTRRRRTCPADRESE